MNKVHKICQWHRITQVNLYFVRKKSNALLVQSSIKSNIVYIELYIGHNFQMTFERTQKSSSFTSRNAEISAMSNGLHQEEK